MGLFYEVIAQEGKKNYLLGTMHINGKEVTTLPTEIVAAIETSETFLFEADVRARHTDKYYQACSNWFRKTRENLDSSITTDLNLSVWNSIDTPISFYQKGILQKLSHHFCDPMDTQLITKLEARNNSIHYLETLDDQRIVFEGLKFDYSQQIEFYEYMSKQPGLNPGFNIENIEALYLQENIAQLAREANPFWGNEDNSVPKSVIEYYADLIQNRDTGLADGLQPHFEQGNAFAAIGAAHLIGVTQSLRQKGFTVNPITLGPRVTPIAAMFGEKAVLSESPHSFWSELPPEQNQEPAFNQIECNPQ